MATETDQVTEIVDLLSQAEGNVEQQLKQRQAADRSIIGLLIIGALVIAITVLFIFVLSTGASNTWEKPAEFLFKVLSSVLLPVVTLVLGYYFGTEKAKA